MRPTPYARAMSPNRPSPWTVARHHRPFGRRKMPRPIISPPSTQETAGSPTHVAGRYNGFLNSEQDQGGVASATPSGGGPGAAAARLFSAGPSHRSANGRARHKSHAASKKGRTQGGTHFSRH